MTTCQICERGIKAPIGTARIVGITLRSLDKVPSIAHHGYIRPHKQGWQSGSCAGARWRPYEVACDALPPAIESCKAFLVRQKAHLEDFTKNPPETLTRYGRRYGQADKVYPRPEGYVYNESHGSFSHDEQYQLEHHNSVYQIKQSIKAAERDLPKLEKRLAAWVPPSK